MSAVEPQQTIGIFYKARVRDVAFGDPITCLPSSPVKDVALAMKARSWGAVVVVDDDHRPLGIVTEQDLVYKVLAEKRDGQTAESIMTSPAASVAPEDFVYQAVQLMLQERCRRLVVIDASGRVTGLLSMPHLLRLRGLESRSLIEGIAKARSVEELKDIRAQVDRLADQLFIGDVDAVVLARILTSFGDAVSQRILQLVVSQLKMEGRSQPHQGYAWVVFGTAGRQEQLLRGDQDNGMILPDSITADGRAFYRELVTRVNDALAEYGYPLCQGGVMAREDGYFGTLSEWKSRASLMVTAAHDGRMLRDLTILMDMRGAAGRGDLVDELRSHLTRAVAASRPAVRALAEDATTKDVPLSLLRRFRYQKDPAGRRGIDVKRQGLLPLTAAVKAHAGDRSVRATETTARIEALREQGVFTRDVAAELVFAHDVFLRLRLQASLEGVLHGHTEAYFVYPQEWTEWDRQDLRRAFKAVDHLQDLLRLHFML